MSGKSTRRKFFKNTAVTAAGLLVGHLSASAHQPIASDSKDQRVPAPGSNLMAAVQKFRKIDTHLHVNLYGTSNELQIMDYADRLGIEKLIVSRPIVEGDANPEEVTRCNNMVIDLMKKHPDRVIGQIFVNPLFQKESMEEIKRCLDQGMIGLKLYHQAKINDPALFPVIEKMIDLKMIILMHAECQLGIGGYRMKYDQKARPDVSIPEDFVDAAKRYPEAMFQFAHIGGGGDWEYECRMIKDYPNIYVDTSGSNNEEYMLDFALRTLGEDRLFFGSDNSFYQGVGKVLASNLTDAQKRKLFFENYVTVLKKGGYHVN